MRSRSPVQNPFSRPIPFQPFKTIFHHRQRNMNIKMKNQRGGVVWGCVDQWNKAGKYKSMTCVVLFFKWRAFSKAKDKTGVGCPQKQPITAMKNVERSEPSTGRWRVGATFRFEYLWLWKHIQLFATGSVQILLKPFLPFRRNFCPSGRLPRLVPADTGMLLPLLPAW